MLNNLSTVTDKQNDERNVEYLLLRPFPVSLVGSTLDRTGAVYL